MNELACIMIPENANYTTPGPVAIYHATVVVSISKIGQIRSVFKPIHLIHFPYIRALHKYSSPKYAS